MNIDKDIIMLRSLTLSNIDYSIRAESNEQVYLVGISCNDGPWSECQVFCYKKFAGVYQSIYEVDPFYASEIEDIVITDKLIYFGALVYGGSFGNGSYHFCAFNFSDQKFYNLEYSWSDFKYQEHGFVNLDNIPASVLKYFENKALDNQYVKHSTGEMSDREKWLYTNKSIYDKLAKESYGIIEHVSVGEQKFSGTFSQKENDHYVVTSEFKGNIYLYDKQSKEHSVIWVPSYFYDTAELVELDEHHLVLIDHYFLDGDVALMFDLRFLSIHVLRE